MGCAAVSLFLPVCVVGCSLIPGILQVDHMGSLLNGITICKRNRNKANSLDEKQRNLHIACRLSTNNADRGRQCDCVLIRYLFESVEAQWILSEFPYTLPQIFPRIFPHTKGLTGLGSGYRFLQISGRSGICAGTHSVHMIGTAIMSVFAICDCSLALRMTIRDTSQNLLCMPRQGMPRYPGTCVAGICDGFYEVCHVILVISDTLRCRKYE